MSLTDILLAMIFVVLCAILGCMLGLTAGTVSKKK